MFSSKAGNEFGFLNGHAGGTDVIAGFKLRVDHLDLMGYGANAGKQALASATKVHGGIQLSLTDGTQVLLTGIHHLHSSSFLIS